MLILMPWCTGLSAFGDCSFNCSFIVIDSWQFWVRRLAGAVVCRIKLNIWSRFKGKCCGNFWDAGKRHVWGDTTHLKLTWRAAATNQTTTKCIFTHCSVISEFIHIIRNDLLCLFLFDFVLVNSTFKKKKMPQNGYSYIYLLTHLMILVVNLFIEFKYHCLCLIPGELLHWMS